MKPQTKLSLERLDIRELLSADLNVAGGVHEPPTTASEESLSNDAASCCSSQKSDVDALGAALTASAATGRHTNPANCLDVNNDGQVTPMDALNIVNALNDGIGVRPLSSLVGAGEDGLPFVDVNGDDFLSPIDLLQVINYLTSSIGAPPADTERPHACLNVSDISRPNWDWHFFTVIYTDNRAVQAASLDDHDVVVTGPNGYRQQAKFVQVDAEGDGNSRAVTYKIPAPRLGWNSSVNGTYSVLLEDGQILDTSDNAARGGALGTFKVDVLDWTPFVPVPGQADIRVVTNQQPIQVHVELTFGGGHRVVDWGHVVRQGNSFVVEANTEYLANGYHFRVLTRAWNAYDLGDLEPGEYTFHFTAHGQLVEKVAFTVTDNESLRTRLDVSDLRDSGGNSHAFTVTYTDLVAVDGATLDSQDIVVTGPNGFRQQATFVSTDHTEDGKHWTATYHITAPNGKWGASDSGTYTIALLPDAVLDTNGRAADGGVLGGFVFAPDGEAAASAPYVPRAADVAITPRPSSGLFADIPTTVRVELKLPYPGFRVVDWGQVTRDGNTLAVNAEVERECGPEQPQVELHLWHEYEVADWPLGECCFTFRVHGRAVRTESVLAYPSSESVDLLSATLLIGDLEAHGTHQLALQDGKAGVAPYLDNDGDAFVSPSDVRLVVNDLNRDESVGDPLSDRPGKWADSVDLAIEALEASAPSSTLFDTLDLQSLVDDLAQQDSCSRG